MSLIFGLKQVGVAALAIVSLGCGAGPANQPSTKPLPGARGATSEALTSRSTYTVQQGYLIHNRCARFCGYFLTDPNQFGFCYRSCVLRGGYTP